MRKGPTSSTDEEKGNGGLMQGKAAVLRFTARFICPVAVGVLAVISGPAWGQQPPDSVTSDANGNTAMGSHAMFFNSNSGGSGGNTAAGLNALEHNGSGQFNTGVGWTALQDNTGSENTGLGAQALGLNTTGVGNTGMGAGALYYNLTGSDNTAIGVQTLALSTGSSNTGVGAAALVNATTGSNNVATGFWALGGTTTGSNNAALGAFALENAASGSNNIGLGYEAGVNVSGGGNNIEIGNLGISSDASVIRIGTAGTHTQTFIAGIARTAVSGSPVYITSSGQLGIRISAERYKTDIRAMGSSSSGLDQLRPVTFRIKDDPEGAVQYGLIAEEVAKVYPELVIHAEDDTILSVHYDQLAPMLLNEMQQQKKEITGQKEQIADQAQELRQLRQQLAELGELKKEFTALRSQLTTTQRARVNLAPGSAL